MTPQAFVLELEKGSEYQPLLEGRPQTCGMRSGRVHLAQGESCGEHSTQAHEEMLVFLAGRGVSILPETGETMPVGVGKVIYISPHTRHNIQNTGPEPLVYIYCVAPIMDDAKG